MKFPLFELTEAECDILRRCHHRKNRIYTTRIDLQFLCCRIGEYIGESDTADLLVSKIQLHMPGCLGLLGWLIGQQIVEFAESQQWSSLQRNNLRDDWIEALFEHNGVKL